MLNISSFSFIKKYSVNRTIFTFSVFYFYISVLFSTIKYIQKNRFPDSIRYVRKHVFRCVLIIKNYYLCEIYNETFNFNFYQMKHFQNQVKRDDFHVSLFLFFYYAYVDCTCDLRVYPYFHIVFSE